MADMVCVSSHLKTIHYFYQKTMWLPPRRRIHTLTILFLFEVPLDFKVVHKDFRGS